MVRSIRERDEIDVVGVSDISTKVYTALLL